MSGHEIEHRRLCGAPTRKGGRCIKHAVPGRATCRQHGGTGGRPVKHGTRRDYKKAEELRTPEQREELDDKAGVEPGEDGYSARILQDVMDHYDACKAKNESGELPDADWRGAAKDYLDIVGRAESRQAEVRSKLTKAGLDDSIRKRIDAGNERVRDWLEGGKDAAERRLAGLPEDGWIGAKDK